MKPDLESVVTAHMVYFCAFARSEIFPKNAWKSGVGRGQFDAGVNGLNTINFILNNKSESSSKNSRIFIMIVIKWNITWLTTRLEALHSL